VIEKPGATVDGGTALVEARSVPGTRRDVPKQQFHRAAVASHSEEMILMDLSAGLRYSKDEKDYTYFRSNPDGTLPSCNPPFGPFGEDQPTNCALAGLFNVPGHFDGTRTDRRVALDYKWTDTLMTYGQISTGSYTSAVYGNAINAATNRIDDYLVANARLTWKASDDRW
jgi:hypothetical protein